MNTPKSFKPSQCLMIEILKLQNKIFELEKALRLKTILLNVSEMASHHKHVKSNYPSDTNTGPFSLSRWKDMKRTAGCIWALSKAGFTDKAVVDYVISAIDVQKDTTQLLPLVCLQKLVMCATISLHKFVIIIEIIFFWRTGNIFKGCFASQSKT